MVKQVSKIRGRSLAELEERCWQTANSFAERARISPQVRLPSGSDLRRHFSLGLNQSDEEIFERFSGREHSGFYASFNDVDKTFDVLRNRFPSECSEIIVQADRIGNGVFDLLGQKDLYFKTKVPNWHFDPISGKTLPKKHWSSAYFKDSSQIGDKKLIWELNRHQYFTFLGQAYGLTRDEKYAEVFVSHLSNWFEENPPKIGVNWLSSLELAFRSISWIWSFYFFKGSSAFTPDIFVQMLKYLYVHGRHMETYHSTYFSPNTHLTGEALGLYLLGSFLPECELAKRWKEKGYRVLLDALDFQVRPDGGYCEQSSHYHRYTTDFYANLLILRRLDNQRGETKHEKKLEQLLEFLMYITQPNGETPLFGDDDGGRLYFLDRRPVSDFRPTLALGAALLGRGDLKSVAGDAGPELLWLLGPEGLNDFEKVEPVEPKEKTVGFESSGFFVSRSSWKPDANYILIDCGPHGFLNGGHAHADSLAFIFTHGGQPIFVDSGTFTYAQNTDLRLELRLSSSHNCLDVNAMSSSVPDGPFSWKSIADSKVLEWCYDGETTHFRGSHDGFLRAGIRYERGISIESSGRVTICDSILTEAHYLYSLNFIVSPHLDAALNKTSLRVFETARQAKTILSLRSDVVGENIDSPGSWSVEDCLVSPGYGKKVKAKKVVFSVSAKGDVRISTVLC